MVKVSHAEQVRLRLDVLDRDAYSCVDCGAYTTEVAHIVSRGREGAWQIKNMVTLCPQCHRLKRKQGGVHSPIEKKRLLECLEERYHYDYSMQPWLGMLGRAA